MSAETREQLKSQMSAEETDNSESTELIHRERFEGSPFYIVGNEEKGYFAAMGKHKVADSQSETVEGVKVYLMDNSYQVTLWMIAVVLTLKEEETREQLAEMIKEKHGG